MRARYKINDKVIVNILGGNQEGIIYKVDRMETKIMYTVLTKRGRKYPYTGIDGSEKFFNIDSKLTKKIKN